MAVFILKQSCQHKQVRTIPPRVFFGGNVGGLHPKASSKSILFALYNAPVSKDMRYFSQVCAQRQLARSNQAPLLRVKPLPLTTVPSRGVGMLIARAIRGVLKLRYIVLGGAIGGGMSLNKVRFPYWLHSCMSSMYSLIKRFIFYNSLMKSGKKPYQSSQTCHGLNNITQSQKKLIQFSHLFKA